MPEGPVPLLLAAMPDGSIGLLIASLALLLLSGFFSAMETAYSCANKIKLRSLSANGNKRAEKTLKLCENFDKLISTILIGNNIVNITLTSLTGVLFAKLITSGADSVTISTIVTTVAVLIIGEITPKMVTKVYPEKIAMAAYPLIMFFTVLFYPINIIFTGYKWLLSKIFKLKNEEVITEDEIMTIVEEAQEDGTLRKDETNLIRSVIEFDDVEVGDILIPRVNISAVEVNTPLDKIKQLFTDDGYSRIPVYKETIDSIIGILHEKEFFIAYLSGKKDVSKLLQNVVYTTEHVKISALLKQLQMKKTHMAVVLDEYGGTLGIVTLEDILEELVGEIWDEHDEEVKFFKPVDDNTILVDAKAQLSDLFDYLGIENEDDNFDANTVSGWIVEQLGEIPAAGKKLAFGDYDIEVLKSTVKKVLQIKMTKREEPEDEQNPRQERKLLKLIKEHENKEKTE